MAQLIKGKPPTSAGGRDIKKGSGYLYRPLLERYHFIEEHCQKFSVATMCDVLQVSRSGYYAWLRRPQSKGNEENARLVEQIKDIHRQSRQTVAHVLMMNLKIRG